MKLEQLNLVQYARREYSSAVVKCWRRWLTMQKKSKVQIFNKGLAEYIKYHSKICFENSRVTGFWNSNSFMIIMKQFRKTFHNICLW